MWVRIEPVAPIPVDEPFDLQSRFQAERVGHDVDDPPLPPDRVDYLDVARGGAQDPDVSGLTAAAGVENRSIEFDPIGCNSDDLPFGGRSIGVPGGDLFGHRDGAAAGAECWWEFKNG